jgi:hypothetical protein
MPLGSSSATPVMSPGYMPKWMFLQPREHRARRFGGATPSSIAFSPEQARASSRVIDLTPARCNIVPLVIAQRGSRAVHHAQIVLTFIHSRSGPV